MSSENIIGAFSEDQVSILTGLSRNQLASWRRGGFVRPAFQNGDNPRQPFTYVYSFKDLLKLRVINQLRNVHGVMLSELKKVEAELERRIGPDAWSKTKLWVHNRKVVFIEPESSKRREVSSKQFVAEIALAVVTTDVRADIRLLNEREAHELGRAEKRRQVVSSSQVFAGTRIPVSVVISYLNVGKTVKEIIHDYPDLTEKDIQLARSILRKQAA
ncbi:DUF433 domain-containing protein [Hyphomonas sp.]|uniref:DUF433 domain-containing protein n=1 Tax=Hyphomonas sp. TaxID=87 RepID=UPI003568957A